MDGALYNASDALAFYFSGSGTRCAYSFSGSASQAALLHVEYSTLPRANTPPACAITAPANGSSYVGTTDVTVTAIATDAGGNVVNVEFLLNGLVVGQDAEAPYSFLIPGLETGSYQLTVKATDDSGSVTISAPVSISIRDQNLLPVCAITSPANNAVFIAPATIGIFADATDSDGSIQIVEFFAGSTKIGEDASSPFSYSWSNVAAGSYSLPLLHPTIMVAAPFLYIQYTNP